MPKKEKREIKKFIKKIKNSPYIIAEAGVNHGGSISRAKKLINLAKKGGASAIKFQTYKAELLASKNSPSYWDLKENKARSQYELFKKYDNFNRKDYKKLKEYCSSKKIDFLSTPFDLGSVDFLSPLVKYFKIASSDITNLPLLRKIASKNKIVFLSTGGSTIKEIKDAIGILKKNGSPLVVILHCILNYPTDRKDANLNMITDLKNNFKNHIIGYSDHTFADDSMLTITTSYLLGAMVIEKHFTDNKKLKGNDHYHSMDMKDLKKLKQQLNFIHNIRGKIKNKKVLKSEYVARLNARRSIIVAKNLKKNEVIKKFHLIAKRPGTGISPMYWSKVLGRKSKHNLNYDHVLQWNDLK